MPNGGLRWDDSTLVNNLRNAPQKADRALTAIMAYHSPRATTWMRTNAPWTDRTGNARNGLFSQPFNDRPKYGIHLSHRVPYGIWLEIRFSGRYAVIDPAMQTQGPEVMRTCQTLFGRMFGGAS